MANKYKIMKEKAKKQANLDILKYFDMAKDTFKKDKKKANLYVHKARLLAMKHNLSFPADIKKFFCKNCYSYIVPGVNCRVRTREGKLIYYCLECKNYMRIPISK
jgi:ribonuclease P protein subunit RPR2